jgi:dephospho-CoA kinase
MLLVGLTGNYGMGKSSVLNQFRECGAVVLDTDQIVSSLLSEEQTKNMVKDLLGDSILDDVGQIKKSKVAEIIFRDAHIRRALEDILHPRVFERIHAQVERLKDTDSICIVEIPLLYERHFDKKFDKTITVYASEEESLNRLKALGIDEETARLRLEAQLPIDDKMQRADYIIDNNGTPGETMDQVKKTYQKLVQEQARC